MRRLLLTILISLFVITFVRAQSFQASVKNTTVGVDDRFEVSFTFSGEDVNKLGNFRQPDFSNFILLSGPNYSTSMQIINGAVSASQTQTFILKPKGTGKFTLGSASIEYAGTVYKSEPLVITVVKGGTQPKTQVQDTGINTKEIAENVFVKATADKNKVYKGEQVIVTFKLYTRLNITGIYTSKVSQQEGFWTEEIETDPKGAPTVETIDGKRFQVYTLKKIAVFPSKTGELTITPNEFRVPVLVQKKRERGGSIFDDFFNDPFFNRNEVYDYSTKSNKLNITALPLPEGNIPQSFKGAVGEFTLNSELKHSSDKTNDPFTLKAQINGTGNIALLSIPELKTAPGLEVYEPKSTDNISRKEKISGTKSIDYLIIPRTSGKKEIPPLEFSYFSPSKRTYVTLKTPVYELNIIQGELAANQDYSGKEEIRLLSEDIRFIKLDGGDIRQRTGILLYSTGFWISVILPVLIFTGLIVWQRRNNRLNSNLELLRYQRAEKIAKNRLKTAKKYLDNKDQVSFYSEISLALSGYIENKFHIPKAEFSLERAAQEMSARGINQEQITRMKTCMERSEFFRFAPHKNGQDDMNDMYRTMTLIIVEIEKALSRGKNGK